MLKEYDFSKAKRGPIVPPKANKTRITIRIDSDILNWFREQVDANGGGSYQSMINLALRDHIQRQQHEDWETALRRIIREELHSVNASVAEKMGSLPLATVGSYRLSEKDKAASTLS